MSADPARRTALEVLRMVREDDAYANLVLPGVLGQFSLSGRDAAFATELTYGTLRWRGFYDVILQRCISRAWGDVDANLVDSLRLGAHQLLNMRVPPHAAVDSTCELVRALGTAGTAGGRVGFVNAVLRKVSAQDLKGWGAEVAPTESIADLATRWSHPAWIVRAFQDALGERREELSDLLRSNNDPAQPALVARPGRIEPALLRGRPEVDPGRLSPLAATLLSGPPEALDVVRSGAVGVQDEGSQLVALAVTRAQVHPRGDAPQQEQCWLDMCAGPGGKAAILVGIAAERGIALVAVEKHPHRGHLVERALRWPASGAEHVRVIVGDALLKPWGDQLFDRVLVDAPCTGLGALRRRPEARWRKTPADLSTLGPLQRGLLSAALDSTKIGGVVIYATCSPHLAETEFVVADVVADRFDAVVEDVRGLMPEATDVGPGPFIQLWPHRHGTDAMFVALLRRV